MSGALNSFFGTARPTVASTPVAFVGVSSITSQTAATTQVAPALTGLQINDKIVAFTAWDPTGNQTPTTSIASGTGATVSWTSLGVWSQPATTGVNDILTQAWIGNVTAITTGSSTTTVTYSASTVASLQVRSFRNMSTTQVSTVVQGRGNSTVNGFSAVTSPTALSGDLIICYSANQQQLGTATYSTSTTNGTWSTGLTTDPAATSNSSPMLLSQYKILTGDGTTPATANNAGVAASAWAYQIFAFSKG